MSNQENTNQQSTQEDVQNLAEEQLEGVTGAGIGFSKIFSKSPKVEETVPQLDLSKGHPTPGRRNNNPALSQSGLNTEVRNMKQKLQDWVNKG
jgi:hypothetical protein